jgi:hypothetical protein
MVHSFEVQIQAYLKQQACPCAAEESLGAPQKGATKLVLTNMKCTNSVHFLRFGLPIACGNSFFI